jgi:hypothetical protein
VAAAAAGATETTEAIVTEVSDDLPDTMSEIDRNMEMAHIALDRAIMGISGIMSALHPSSECADWTIPIAIHEYVNYLIDALFAAKFRLDIARKLGYDNPPIGDRIVSNRLIDYLKALIANDQVELVEILATP